MIVALIVPFEVRIQDGLHLLRLRESSNLALS